MNNFSSNSNNQNNPVWPSSTNNKAITSGFGSMSNLGNTPFGSNTSLSTNGFGNNTTGFGSNNTPSNNSTGFGMFSGGITNPTANSTQWGNKSLLSSNNGNTLSGFGGSTPNSFFNSTANNSLSGFGGSLAKPLAPPTSGWGSLNTSSNFNNATNSLGSSALGGGWNSSKGTSSASYTETKFTENYEVYSLVDISCQPQYSDKNIDILRIEDYSLGRKPSNSTGGLSNPLSNNTSQFGANNTTLGINNTALGSGNTNMFQNSFNQSSIPSGNSFSGFSAFNKGPTNTFNQPSMATTPFSQSSTTPSFSTATTSFNQPSTAVSPFGQSNTGVSSSFNQPSSATTPFGQSSAAPSFSATKPSFSSAFGSSQPIATPTPSPFSSAFGNSSANNLFTTQSPANSQSTNSTLWNSNNNNAIGVNTIGHNTLNNINSLGSGTPMGKTTQNAPSALGTMATCINSNPYGDNNLNDPYLLSNITFQDFNPVTYKKSTARTLELIPKVIFNKNLKNIKISDNSSSIEIGGIRPPRKHLSEGIYTKPADYKKYKYIDNFILGIEGVGRIEYLEPIDTEEVLNIETIRFNTTVRESVDINSTPLDDIILITDPIGFGLNKSAKVFLENIYPFSRKLKNVEQWPDKGILGKFLYQLKTDEEKEFVDYNINTGIYVYKVKHF